MTRKELNSKAYRDAHDHIIIIFGDQRANDNLPIYGGRVEIGPQNAQIKILKEDNDTVTIIEGMASLDGMIAKRSELDPEEA